MDLDFDTALAEVADALDYLDRLMYLLPGPGAAGSRPAGGVEVADREELLRLARPITADDPLWNIVGIAVGDADGPTDVSSNKHKYLAEIYGDLHRE